MLLQAANNLQLCIWAQKYVVKVVSNSCKKTTFAVPRLLPVKRKVKIEIKSPGAGVSFRDFFDCKSAGIMKITKPKNQKV